MPQELRPVVEPLPYWFVIGGQAVRCLVPYRPSRDVDFGTLTADSVDRLVAELARTGHTEILERHTDTVHLTWNGIKISVFRLEELAPHVEERRLSITGLLATKLHAILDRGTRRDFFDLYVLLETERLGIAECLRAVRELFRQEVNDSLLLRALAYFDDADAEAPLPGEGSSDWNTVRDFFRLRVGYLLVPPNEPLVIQSRRVDVAD
jgi:Nucleotidyl transferase AbiEii toxin, Type IV TA system